MSTTHSSLHADHQLDQLAGQFEHWRQTVSGDLKLLSGGQAQNVSVPLSVFFLNM
jgi:ABC-type uncharacterized transport system ATPase component